MGLFGLFNKDKKEKLDQGLDKTKEGLLGKLTRAVAGKSKVDDQVLDELEEILVTSDVGVATTLKVIERIEARVAKDKYVGTEELQGILREEIAALLEENGSDSSNWTLHSDKKPYVIMVVGVNGAGKTTLLRMVSGLELPTGGMALINGFDVVNSRSLAQRSMGLWYADFPLFMSL